MQLPADFHPDFPGLADALATTTPSVAIRLNKGKTDIDAVGGERVPWCRAGRYLPQRPDFTFDPAIHQGRYYVQDPSSMIYSHIADILARKFQHPVVALDACAAPGGKTTAIIDSLPHGSLVVANEYVPTRADILHENTVKWGYPATIVSRGDTTRFTRLNGMFDIIAADVPCSGEGMFRKDPDAIAQWSTRLVDDCADLQRSIVANLWPSLAPGGFLIYSTCTFNRKENQDNITFFLDNLPGAMQIEIPVDPTWGIVNRDATLHFLPGKIRGEGLSVALLQKSPDDILPRRQRQSKRRSASSADIDKSLRQWLIADDYALHRVDNRIVAIPTRWVNQIMTLDATLSLPWGCGLEIATIKGRDIIPSHALAMSPLINPEAFARAELDYPTAIAYLRRDTISLPVDTPRGFVIPTYTGLPLGFVKNIGSRANNLYPQQWRILSTHTSATPPSILSL